MTGSGIITFVVMFRALTWRNVHVPVPEPVQQLKGVPDPVQEALVTPKHGGDFPLLHVPGEEL
jgi:hypothetical protein